MEAMEKPKKRSALRHACGRAYYGMRRKVLLRKLKDVDMWLQQAQRAISAKVRHGRRAFGGKAGGEKLCYYDVLAFYRREVMNRSKPSVEK